MLSGDPIDQWSKNGYFILENVFSPYECQELIDASRRLDNFRDLSFRPCMHPHRSDPFFLTAMRQPTIVATMEALLKGKVDAIQSQYFFCQPGTPGFTAHQDNHYVKAQPDAFASAWLALEDVSPENGGLVVYGGSHIETLLPVKKVAQGDNTGQDPNANYQEVVLEYDKYRPMDIWARKGSVVFLHGHTVHWSHHNNSNRSRNVLLMTYVRKGESFREGYAAKRAAVELYGKE